jgi:seryl-tRNA synthetase|tara:strand:+ start:1636 stop:1920 length:285 start_codon:yes stop_codon:yes gene_type:complete
MSDIPSGLRVREDEVPEGLQRKGGELAQYMAMIARLEAKVDFLQNEKDALQKTVEGTWDRITAGERAEAENKELKNHIKGLKMRIGKLEKKEEE